MSKWPEFNSTFLKQLYFLHHQECSKKSVSCVKEALDSLLLDMAVMLVETLSVAVAPITLQP